MCQKAWLIWRPVKKILNANMDWNPKRHVSKRSFVKLQKMNLLQQEWTCYQSCKLSATSSVKVSLLQGLINGQCWRLINWEATPLFLLVAVPRVLSSLVPLLSKVDSSSVWGFLINQIIVNLHWIHGQVRVFLCKQFHVETSQKTT